jgi:hypothetical protein
MRLYFPASKGRETVLGQTVPYGDLSNENPAPITPAHEHQADAVIELQLEKAGVRLASQNPAVGRSHQHEEEGPPDSPEPAAGKVP